MTQSEKERISDLTQKIINNPVGSKAHQNAFHEWREIMINDDKKHEKPDTKGLVLKYLHRIDLGLIEIDTLGISYAVVLRKVFMMMDTNSPYKSDISENARIYLMKRYHKMTSLHLYDLSVSLMEIQSSITKAQTVELLHSTRQVLQRGSKALDTWLYKNTNNLAMKDLMRIQQALDQYRWDFNTSKELNKIYNQFVKFYLKKMKQLKTKNAKAKSKE